MRMKSVIAGAYTAPPAHGPKMALICGLGAVLAREVEAGARAGIGIAGAAQSDQGHRPGVGPLDFFLGVAGPIAADLVEIAAQSGAVARVADENGADPAIRFADAE